MANKPTNPQLYSRVKAQAKKKFDRWPSAYGSAWLVKEYKRRGGGYRTAKDGMEIPGYDLMANGGMMENRIQRLENREANLVARGNRAVDEGRERRADRLLGRAARVENRLIKAKESASKKNMMDVGSVEWAPDPLFHNSMGGMMYGDYTFPMMDDGGEMALGQIAAVTDKMSKLQQFLNPNSNVEPWVASKLAVMDDSAGAIYDYMMYNPEAQESEEPEMEEMRNGGIPNRYKNMGFNKVGVKKQSNRSGKKWMVLAKKDDKYKVVHGGYKGMKDFTQHRNENRRDRFWNRMGGRNSAKATDPFSPLYWHKRFGTWAEGGEPQNEGFQALPQEVQAKIMANMMYGGDMYAMGGMPCYECGGQMKYKKGGTPFIAMAYFEDGGIKIDPAKKGTFKAQATRMGMGVQEAAEAILNAPEGRYSPEMRRKANFARNFAKEYGGMMEYETGGSGMGNMYMNQMKFDMLQAGLPESRISPDLATMGEYQLNEQEAPAGFVSDIPAPAKRGAASGMGQMAMDEILANAEIAARADGNYDVDNVADNAAYEAAEGDLKKYGTLSYSEPKNTQMGPMLPGQQLSSDFSKFWETNNPFDKKDIAYMTQNKRGQPMDEDMYRLKKAASEIGSAVVDKGKDYLKDRYADYSTFGKGFKSATNALGDLVSLGSWFGKRNKENTARVENSRRSFSDNLFPTMPPGITGERGNFDAFGNFRPDETLASRTYFSQMGGEIEMTDDQIRQLVALGAEIEILD